MPSEITTLPLYAQYFRDPTENGPAEIDWNGFKSHDLASIVPLSECQTDFSVHDREWQGVAKQIVVLILEIVIFPWGLYELTRYTVQRLIMGQLYPAQSRRIQARRMLLGEEALNESRQNLENRRINDPGFVVRNIILEKNGTRYSGLLMGRATTITNGRWALQATGNSTPIEHVALYAYDNYINCGYNTLLINGPSVGRSEGHATPDSMGEAQEVGISFLETAIKGNKIVIAGCSLGGAAIGQAILKHTFKTHVKYLVIRQMTFDSASNVCAEVFGKLKWLVKRIVPWSGCEMNNTTASRKLQELQITEVIVQAGFVPAMVRPTKEYLEDPVNRHNYLENFTHDGVISQQASHGRRLIEEQVVGHKVFRCLPHAEHCPPDYISAAYPEIRAL
jgi:hypothetical protein